MTTAHGTPYARLRLGVVVALLGLFVVGLALQQCRGRQDGGAGVASREALGVGEAARLGGVGPAEAGSLEPAARAEENPRTGGRGGEEPRLGLRTVQGRVIDGTGRGIEGIPVVGKLLSAKTKDEAPKRRLAATSDADGRFTLDVPNEALAVWALPGAAWYGLGYTYVGAGDDEVSIRLTPATTVRGVVLMPDERPLAGAKVRAVGERSEVLAGAVADGSGAFELVVPSQVLRLDVYYVPTTTPSGGKQYVQASGVRVRPADGRRVVVRLTEGVRIEGVVVDAAGDPVLTGAVSARPAEGPWHWSTMTRGALLNRKSNRFVIRGVAPGPYIVSFRPHSREVATPLPIRIEAPASGVVVRCPKGHVLKGHVVGADPHSFFVVWMRRAPGDPDRLMAAQSTRSGPAGSFAFRGVSAAGDTLLYAYLPGDERYALILRPPAPDEDVQLHLRNGLSIEGRILSPDGGWENEFSTPKVGVEPSYARYAFPAAVDGSFRVTGLPEGRYQLYMIDQQDPNRGRFLLGDPVEAGSTGLLFPLP